MMQRSEAKTMKEITMSNMPRARRTLSRLARQITNLSLALNDIQEEIEECMSADLKRSKEPEPEPDLE